MAFKFDCKPCGKELNRPGAILFSADPKDGTRPLKYHICADCEEPHLRLIADCTDCGEGPKTGYALFVGIPDMSTFDAANQSVEAPIFHICEICFPKHLAPDTRP